MFLSAWRNTIPRREWFKFPSDPRQREKEHPWYLLVLYVAVAVQLTDSEEGRDLSAPDVYEFMLQRAKEYPLCMLVLLEMRLATVAKMMKNAERIGERGSVEPFLTAVKFAMRLFAMTHKTNYCDCLVTYCYSGTAHLTLKRRFIAPSSSHNSHPMVFQFTMTCP